MLNLYHLPESQMIIFALILMRMLSFIISSAVLGSPTVSIQVKVLLSIVITAILYPTVKITNPDLASISNDIILLTAREILIGLTLGFLTRLFFFAVTMTGDLVSLSVGLNASQLYNPMLGQNGNTLDQFYSLIATLIFFSVNGHHLLISALAQSFEMIPAATLKLNYGVYAEIAAYGQQILVMAIKMSAPVIVAVLVANLSMGILGRAIPQINVLVTSLPVTITIGMGVVFVCLPLIVLEMNGLLDATTANLFAVMKHL